MVAHYLKIAVLAAAIAAPGFAFAQGSPAAPQQPPLSPAAAAPKAAPANTVSAKKCMRLPLSDIAFEREPTIAQARMRLGEYAADEAKKRGWGATTKSLETVSCEVYLVLPLLGTEYKCLVTATFCTK